MPIISPDDLDPSGTYSYADYLSWQFEELVELIRGKVLRRMSAPTDLHQVIAGNLFAALHIYLRRQPGPVPCATLPGLGLEWGDVFPAPVR